MCNCSKLGFSGTPSCGCGGHAPAVRTGFDGTGINNGDTLTDEAAMRLVEQLLICADETAELPADQLAQLKVTRFAKMRLYLDTNKLALTEENITTYAKQISSPCGTPELLARHPFLKAGAFIVLLLALSITGLYFLTRHE